MKRTLVEVTILTAMVMMLALAVARADSGDTRSSADRACTPSESWSFGPAISGERRSDFRHFLDQKMRPAQGFAEGLAERSIAQSDEAKVFGEYWLARALYEAKLVHLAYDGFTLIASRPVTSDTAGVQIAALDCLLQISTRYPSIAVPNTALARAVELLPEASTSGEHQAIWEAGGTKLRQDLADGHTERMTLEKDLSLVTGGGAFESLARGFAAAARRDHNTAITQLDHFLNTPAIPSRLGRFVDPARILMARSLYTMQQFDRSVAQLRLVSKSSNELADSLSELSWAFLMNERYSEAIGTAMSLHAGGLRRTFTPEAGMVMAMALNELCQYPESVNAINVLRKSYDHAYHWLSQWDAGRKKGENPSLYALAVDFVKKRPIPVPDKVAGEWVRSPLVIASQEEIDLFFDEADAATALGHSGLQEQRREAELIIQMAHELRPKLDDARKFRKPGDSLPPTILTNLGDLKREIAHFKRLQHAAPVWRAVLANSQRKSPQIEKSLVARINTDLEHRSQRMLGQLEEIAENVQMIEIEIYNGASQDIIWQNAHPDYRELAERMKNNGVDSADKVWDWGRAPAYDSDDVADNSEIWEDELGSFKANLFDNCSSKDKYLALKLSRHKH